MQKSFVLLNKTLVIGILFLFIGMCANPSFGITVEKESNNPIKNGNTLYVGGSGPNNYTKIQDAIDNASDGDTVYVYNGTYYENVIIDKYGISLIGEDKNTTFIDGGENGDVIKVDTDWFNITKFSIANAGPSEFYDAGIDIGSSFCNIEKCDFYNNGYTGVRLNYANNIDISDCNFLNNYDHGAYFRYSQKVKVLNCTFYNNSGWSMRIDHNSNNVKLLDCNYFNNRVGIFFIQGANNNIVKKCKFYNNSEGIVIHHGGGGPHPYNNVIENCEIYDNSNGIRLNKSIDNTILNNSIYQNNENGIIIFDNSYNNIIYHNNFINNTQNAYDDGENIWDNSNSGNYWDDYTGNDSDGDGIGDTPYPIPGGNNSDRYPLMAPWGGNHPPMTPVIEGKRRFKEGEGGSYPYTIYSIDPDGDDILYLINWNDGTTDWIGPFESGKNFTRDVPIPKDEGTYFIFKVKAIDIYGAESNWAILEVTVPRTRASSYLWYEWLLERFPLLQRLLCLLL